MDLQPYSVRTDLALEARELVADQYKNNIPGVEMDVDEEGGEIKVTTIHVQNEEGSRALGKLPGRYITFEAPGLRRKDTDLQNALATRFAQYFADFLAKLNIKQDAKVLMIGLGNWNVTPDALGPIVIENVLVTRHYFELVPEQVEPGYREVSAVSPGVLGITGIETSEIVHGVIEKTKPDFVIAVDALASKAVERVNTTIQIADTGIHPGSGIGNKRKGVTKQELGIPVIAIGVPTVVFASTIVNNSIEMVIDHFKNETNNTRFLFGQMENMKEHERLSMVKEVLEPVGQDLLVTPKDIDEFIEDIANVIASGLNAALHQAIDKKNVAAYTH
ncbi:GPR endopeptidase [Longirhabdus pacifica]|uniref:GPR endopeptidase n=1 Tax=Longirhabdus pacifica TaxID=2305227 RepID=UPI0010086A1A|nr:GPR endopeptidase [Longirhabdus pacifica]